MADANYVGACFDFESDCVNVWERSSSEERVLKRYKAPRYFYTPCKNGEYKSIFGEALERHDFDSVEEWNIALKAYQNKHESDIQPLFKVLMNEYYNKPNPILNYAFLDIESDIRDSVGFCSAANPYAPINAVTIYQSWTKKYLTFVVPPKGYDVANFDSDIEAMAKELNISLELNIELCKNEIELLIKLVDSIQNADLISGWNSEFFDLPYIIRRLERVAPKLVHKMSFIGARPPKASTVLRFGEEQIVYKLFGRTHIDYLDLFKKFAQDVKYPSYKLEAVGEAEVKMPKIHFDGTFEQFYNNEFPKFTLYNLIDVNILVRINDKRKLMSLVNNMAHESTCLFENLLGTVRYIETALISRAHNIHKLIVRDKAGLSSDGKVVDGALVLDPVAGLHEWLGSVDINSLYPSTIRSLNISPEKIVGNFISGNCSNEIKTNGSRFVPISNKTLPEWKKNLICHNFDKKNPNATPDGNATTAGEYDWAGIIEGDDMLHTLHLDPDMRIKLGQEDEYLEATGQEWQEILKEQKWAISAFGTVFDQSSGLGLIPDALQSWYAERKQMQAEKKKWEKELIRLEKEGGSKEEIAEADDMVEYFELRQMSKKLTLNSLYGAMLSPHFGLGRKEMGASVTACGRAITKHMIETIGKTITGNPVEITWYIGPSKKVASREEGEDDDIFSAKRTVCFDLKEQQICKDTLLSDTDSVAPESLISTSLGDMSIEKYFETLSSTKLDLPDKREFALGNGTTSLGYENNFPIQKEVKYVYRHKTEKQRYLIELENGRSVIVTEDHSIMVLRNGKLLSLKPTEINIKTDICISIPQK